MTACSSRIAFVLLLLATGLLAACAMPAAQTPPATQAPAQSTAGAPVTVQFVNPSGLAEVRNNPQQGDSYNKAWMDALSRHLEQRAPRYLAPDTHLLVQFTEIKLAGDYEPWRRAALDNVRIVRDIYPPRIDLNYQLTGSKGQTLKQGSSKLRDPAFLMQVRGYPSDPLRYEKSMLDDWLQQEFGTD
ncbi:DUF3016 domain-containing protein [Pollutimonas bauzanensis]|uniref:DUF3016 domain-containing protein n=1 Tax=Pollutimonas bauzanensis TaxID=658167 RepID=A0A1M5W3G7_9BURK|nr:DUF3016 domain-containing protein [Pollutimonas bauzanensis]SHH82052.1 Protein of unknown function [Pollutimonas bauzanensis]